MFYSYFEGKIVLIFRKVGKNPQHNGIWIAIRKEDHASLKQQFPPSPILNLRTMLQEPKPAACR